MKCEVCPVPGDLPCLGLIHPPACDDVRNGLPGRARQLLILATDNESPQTEAETAELKAAVDAEFARHTSIVDHDVVRMIRIAKTESCPRWISGGCGCVGSTPRVCDRDGQPRLVMIDECLACPVSDQNS